MKNTPAGVTSFVAANGVGFRADLFQLTLVDGTIYRWTTCDKDIKISGNTWLANGAVLGRGNRRQVTRLEVDVMDVDLAGAVQLAGKSIALQALRGYFDEARLQLDHLVGADLTNALSLGPTMALYEGRVAGSDPTPTGVKLLVLNDLETLNILLPRFRFDLTCQHAVYDPNCTLIKGTFTLTGTASGVPTTTTVPTTTAGIIAKATNWFNLGPLQMTSGAQNGARRSIKTSVLSGGTTTFTTYLPFAGAPAAGDTFSVYPGCPRTQAACGAFPNAIGVTDNRVNGFRGFPHIPSVEGGQ
jgi:hypothetical protein